MAERREIPVIEDIEVITEAYSSHLECLNVNKEKFRTKCFAYVKKNRKRIKDVEYLNCIIELCEIDRLILLKPFVEAKNLKEFVSRLTQAESRKDY